MRIRYETTADDMVAFNQYFCDHSPTMRLARRRFKVAISGICVSLGIGASYLLGDEWLFFHGFALAIAALILIPTSMPRKHLERTVRQLLSEGDNKGTLGEHELELIGDGFIERTTFNESKWSFAGIERVVVGQDYTFIFISALMAHVIPHHRILEGDFQSFMAFLESRVANRQEESDAEESETQEHQSSRPAPRWVVSQPPGKKWNETAFGWGLRLTLVLVVNLLLGIAYAFGAIWYWQVLVGEPLERDCGFRIGVPHVRENGSSSPRPVVTIRSIEPAGVFDAAGFDEDDIVKGMTANELFQFLERGRGKQVSLTVVDGGDGPPLDQRQLRLITFVVPARH